MSSDAITIDADFPGGNIVVDEIAGDKITVHQDLRDTVGDWFYWYFRVQGIAGRTLTVQFSQSTAIGVRGPAVSTDAANTWIWLGAESVEGQSFTYAAPADVDEVRFSFGMPYVGGNLDEFLTGHADHPRLERTELCVSENGRTVDLLKVKPRKDDAARRVLITCRHHCCEMMASYVLEGLLDSVLTADDPLSRWLADEVEFSVVPFVDKDGVEQGDQGKNRAPHDHNRDYGPDDGIYAAIRSMRDLVEDPSMGGFDVALDLHCPWISGTNNESIYFVGTKNEENWKATQVLAEHLRNSCEGPLKYRPEANIPYGTAWNTDDNYSSRDGQQTPQMSNGRYLDAVPDVDLHVTVEFPYANAEGAEVNADSARMFGADLAHAVQKYLADVVDHDAS